MAYSRGRPPVLLCAAGGAPARPPACLPALLQLGLAGLLWRAVCCCARQHGMRRIMGGVVFRRRGWCTQLAGPPMACALGPGGSGGGCLRCL